VLAGGRVGQIIIREIRVCQNAIRAVPLIRIC
jgi:hypothetical protein